ELHWKFITGFLQKIKGCIIIYNFVIISVFCMIWSISSYNFIKINIKSLSAIFITSRNSV
ncbi:MAG: hypothetical protein MST05_13670, partial [Treponema sp.]|nr:hypothetical protein [Treponema sp.]